MGRKRKTPPRFPNLHAAMLEKGINRCAELTGVNASTYQSLQSGRSDPRKETIDALLVYTGLTYEEAFGDEQ